ncbi:C-C motif chemokine 3-like [Serinus canaria]|uniref:C-C motif chemokine 3-like n=1 Tax=Serinus canaria TaxID=9135 RepID=UPI0004F12C40|nr:C-C motif chemokine 3-like [Serinus canaria]
MLTARPVLLLLGLLALSLCCHAAPYSPAECCFDYVKGVLRLDYLLDFYPTGRECYFPAVVFETKKGAKVCAKPEEKWVKRAVKVLQKKKEPRAP